MDFRDRIEKVSYYECDDWTFETIVKEAFGKIIEINAEELDMYESSIRRTAADKWRYEHNEKAFEKFKEDGTYPGTSVLLTAMCIAGYIDKGEYLITYGG